MQISVRELKAHLSRYLAQASRGEAIEITSHRKVIARLNRAAPSGGAGVTALLATGLAHWEGGKPEGAEINLAEGGLRVSDIVLRDRG
ncbi:MAG: type II toxin-antitoxin system Phd/YefM family antitoxin [Sulfuricellaceae bacterium]|jgi:antitoxin (DNA-binding transcriptional repressor) of toxin-antitoxin stability system